MNDYQRRLSELTEVYARELLRRSEVKAADFADIPRRARELALQTIGPEPKEEPKI